MLVCTKAQSQTARGHFRPGPATPPPAGRAGGGAGEGRAGRWGCEPSSGNFPVTAGSDAATAPEPGLLYSAFQEGARE